jgi:hypothetical protein
MQIIKTIVEKSENKYLTSPLVRRIPMERGGVGVC